METNPSPNPSPGKPGLKPPPAPVAPRPSAKPPVPIITSSRPAPKPSPSAPREPAPAAPPSADEQSLQWLLTVVILLGVAVFIGCALWARQLSEQMPSATAPTGVLPAKWLSTLLPWRIEIFALFSASLWGWGWATAAAARWCRLKGLSPQLMWLTLLALPGYVAVLAGAETWWILFSLPGLMPLAWPALASLISDEDPGAPPRPRDDGRWRPLTLLGAMIIFLGIFGAYHNTFISGMALDNKYIIEEYYHDTPALDTSVPVVSLHFAKYLFAHDYWWPKGISGLFRPLTSFSYWLNYIYRDNKLEPFRYHVVNLILHWLTGLMLFVLVRKMSGRYLAALAAGLIFVTHPIATESVTNIIGRADIVAVLTACVGLFCYIRATDIEGDDRIAWVSQGLLAGAFVLVSAAIFVLAFSHWFENTFPAGVVQCVVWTSLIGAGICALEGLSTSGLGLATGDGAKGLWLAGLMLITAVGVFSKESAVTVAGVVVLYELIFRTDIGRRPLSNDLRRVGMNLARCALAVGPVLLFMYVARLYVYNTSTPPEEPFLDNPIRGQSFIAGRMTAVDVAGRLFTKLLWPQHLSADYSWNQIPLFWWTPGWHNTEAVLWLLFFVAVLAFAVWMYFRSKTICFFILFYYAGYAPTANIVKVIGSIMGERFMYMPLIGFAAVAGLTIDIIARCLDALARGPRSQAALPETDAGAEKPSPLLGPLGWVPYVAMLVVIGLFCWRSVQRNKDWQDDITLFESGIKECPLSFRCYQSLAFAYLEDLSLMNVPPTMRPLPAEYIAKVDRLYKTAETALPIVDVLPPDKDSSRLYLHLGMYYTRKADTLCTFSADGTPIDNDDSRLWLNKAVDVLQHGEIVDKTFNRGNRQKDLDRGTSDDEIRDTGMSFLYEVLGPALLRLGRFDEGMAALQYDRHLAPADVAPLAMMFNAQAKRGQLVPASVLAAQILLLHPEQTQCWNLLRQILPKIAPNSHPLLGDHFDLQDPVGRQIVYLAYRDETWVLFEAKLYSRAKALRDAAVINCKFPPDGFPALKDLSKPDPIQ